MNLIGTVSGADVSPGIEGWDIYVQINDGGVDNGYPADVNTPTLTNIDLTTGIFAGSNNSGGNLGENISPDGLIGGDSVATPSGTNLVPSNGILGTLTFNAAGIAPGTTFDVYFYNVASDPSGYFPGGTDSDFNTGSASNAFSGNYLNYTPRPPTAARRWF